jgi:hypothetical protein
MARDAKGKFVKGEPSGNPNGRPKGARDRNGLLTLVDALVDDLAINATALVDRLRREEPGVYANVVAKLIPRELILTHLMPVREPEMTEEELLVRIQAITTKKDIHQQPH